MGGRRLCLWRWAPAFFLRSSISLLQVPRYGQPGLTSWSRWVTGSTPTQGLLYESEDTVSLLSLDPTRSPSQLSSATPTSTTTSSRLLPSTVQVTSRSLPCIPMSVLWYFRTSLYLIVKRIKSSKENPSPASVSFSHIRAPISWWNTYIVVYELYILQPVSVRSNIDVSVW